MSRARGLRGLSVLEAAFAVPGDLSAPTGGYAYARMLLSLAADVDLVLHHVPLPAGFPHPSPDDMTETAARLRNAPGAVLLVDGLAYGAFTPDLVSAIDRPIVALVHHPLALETGLDPARREALAASERDALAHAHAVVASSPETGRILVADYGVPVAKVTIVEPGTDPAPRSHGTGDPVQLLGVGAVSPRKGFDVLIGALAGLADLPWRLTVAGSLDRDPTTVGVLAAAIERAGLGARVKLVGALGESELSDLYATADVLVSPSLFEGYGMALAEALARGLPLVASTGGAAAQTVPDGAGLKVPPGDVASLRNALARMIADAGLRRRCADASWAAGQSLPRWIDTARKIAAVLRDAAR
jgi:glycosyltransferase involved in cell wall biosynthesis